MVAQRDVPAATNEIAVFAPLLAGLDLAGVVVTADALHTQRDHASFLIGRGADDLLVVKATSQPCTPSWPGCRGARSRSWTAPVIMAMGGSRSGP